MITSHRIYTACSALGSAITALSVYFAVMAALDGQPVALAFAGCATVALVVAGVAQREAGR